MTDNREEFLDYFDETASVAGKAQKWWRTLIYGKTAAGNFDEILTDGAGNVHVTDPADEYTLAYTGAQLDTITRTSDSKVITLTWVGDNLTVVSDWT